MLQTKFRAIGTNILSPLLVLLLYQDIFSPLCLPKWLVQVLSDLLWLQESTGFYWMANAVFAINHPKDSEPLEFLLIYFCHSLTDCPGSVLLYCVFHSTGIQNALQRNNLILTIWELNPEPKVFVSP